VTEPDPIPHWPGRLISLGDHQVFVRSVPGSDSTVSDSTVSDSTVSDSTVSDSTKLENREPGEPQPALCVHGLEGSSRNWTDLMDLLRPALACDALDLPGFGDSPPRPDGRYSIAALAQTVIALIEQDKRGPVHLIGNSLGGAVCLKVAAARPDLTRTLTLISPALPDLRPRLDLIRFPVIGLPRVGPRLIRQYQVTQPPERRVAAVIATCYSNPGLYPQARFAAEVAELNRRDSLEYAAAALVGSARALSAEFLRKGRRSPWRDAGRVTAPTLVIYGQHDRLVDPRAAGRAAHMFSDARIVVLPRTGHIAQMERPGWVAAEIGILLGIPGALPRLSEARTGEGRTQPVRS
jgi:pimeloyl-ACP methyl ester carboxylesterase